MSIQPTGRAPNPDYPPQQAKMNRAINRTVLVVAAFLAGVGVMRLLATLLSGEALPLRPVDSWIMMSLRFVAFLFTIGMMLVKALRVRFFLFMLSLVLLTGSGLWLRLASLLPVRWQPTASIAQLLMSVLGLGFIIAGLVQGDDLVLFVQETWGKAFSRPNTPT